MANPKEPKKPSSGFADIVNEFAEADKLLPRRKSQPTTMMSMLNTAVTEYPRETATASVAGLGAYKVVAGYKQALKEGIDLVRTRVKEEKATIDLLEKRGIKAIPRLSGTNTDIRALAKEYAIEKMFTGFPFYNSQSTARIGDIKQGRAILTGETIPRITADDVSVLKQSKYLPWVEPTLKISPSSSPYAVAVDPRQVTLETAKGIPKLDLKPRVTGTGEGALVEKAYELPKGTPRVESAKPYVPPSGIKPSMGRRLAEVSTGGKFGKANVALEALGVANDIFDSEGNIQRSIREGRRYGGALGAGVSGLMTIASRAGRGATNAILAGTPEYLGVYDTMDIVLAGKEGEKQYLRNRKSLGQPPVVSQDNPYVQMFQAQAMAEKEIQASPVIDDWYKGPNYDYKVIDGKLVAIINPLYGAMLDQQSQESFDRFAQSRPMFNADPKLGAMGYQFRPQSAFNFGDYTEYMQDR